MEKIRIFNFVGTSIEIAGQGWWLVHPALDPNKIYEGWGHFGTTMKNWANHDKGSRPFKKEPGPESQWFNQWNIISVLKLQNWSVRCLIQSSSVLFSSFQISSAFFNETMSSTVFFGLLRSSSVFFRLPWLPWHILEILKLVEKESFFLNQKRNLSSGSENTEYYQQSPESALWRQPWTWPHTNQKTELAFRGQSKASISNTDFFHNFPELPICPKWPNW